MKYIHQIFHSIDKKIILTAACFLVLFFFFIFGISNISKETERQETETLHATISRNIAHYYASKGCYPESLEELEEYYEIMYNRDKYFVDYQILGSNIFPDVTIIEK